MWLVLTNYLLLSLLSPFASSLPSILFSPPSYDRYLCDGYRTFSSMFNLLSFMICLLFCLFMDVATICLFFFILPNLTIPLLLPFPSLESHPSPLVLLSLISAPALLLLYILAGPSLLERGRVWSVRYLLLMLYICINIIYTPIAILLSIINSLHSHHHYIYISMSSFEAQKEKILTLNIKDKKLARLLSYSDLTPKDTLFLNFVYE